MEEVTAVPETEEAPEDLMVKIETIISEMDDTQKMIYGGVALAVLLLLICCICKCCLVCRRKRMERRDREK